MNKYVFHKFTSSDYNEEKGIILATLTSFNNQDRVGDVVKFGALDNFMKEYDTIPMYYQHSNTDYIGEWKDFRIEGDKFKATGTFDNSGHNTRAEEVKRYIKDDKLKGVSVGIAPRGTKSYDYYDTDKSPWGMARKFNDIDLTEASTVFVPMNEKAQIEAYKAYEKHVEDQEMLELFKDGEYDLRNIERVLGKYMTRKQATDFINIVRNKEKPVEKSTGKDFFNEVNKRLKEELNKG